MTEWLRRLWRGKPRYEAELVGVHSGTRYPCVFVRFHTREEGEDWISSRPPVTNPPVTRWELIER